MQTSRVRSAGVAANTLRTGTIASRNGNATVAPTPRRNVRRGIGLPAMKSTYRLLRKNVTTLIAEAAENAKRTLSRVRRPQRLIRCDPALFVSSVLTDSARFIWNASLFTTPRMNDDNLYSFASAALAIARIAG